MNKRFPLPRFFALWLILGLVLPNPAYALRESQEDTAVPAIAAALLAGAEEKLISISDSKKLKYPDVVIDIDTGIRYYVVNVAGGVAELQMITNPPDVRPVGRLVKRMEGDLEKGFQKVVTAAGAEQGTIRLAAWAGIILGTLAVFVGTSPLLREADPLRVGMPAANLKKAEPQPQIDRPVIPRVDVPAPEPVKDQPVPLDIAPAPQPGLIPLQQDFKFIPLQLEWKKSEGPALPGGGVAIQETFGVVRFDDPVRMRLLGESMEAYAKLAEGVTEFSMLADFLRDLTADKEVSTYHLHVLPEMLSGHVGVNPSKAALLRQAIERAFRRTGSDRDPAARWAWAVWANHIPALEQLSRDARKGVPAENILQGLIELDGRMRKPPSGREWTLEALRAVSFKVLNDVTDPLKTDAGNRRGTPDWGAIASQLGKMSGNASPRRFLWENGDYTRLNLLVFEQHVVAGLNSLRERVLSRKEMSPTDRDQLKELLLKGNALSGGSVYGLNEKAKTSFRKSTADLLEMAYPSTRARFGTGNERQTSVAEELAGVFLGGNLDRPFGYYLSQYLIWEGEWRALPDNRKLTLERVEETRKSVEELKQIITSLGLSFERSISREMRNELDRYSSSVFKSGVEEVLITEETDLGTLLKEQGELISPKGILSRISRINKKQSTVDVHVIAAGKNSVPVESHKFSYAQLMGYRYRSPAAGAEEEELAIQALGSSDPKTRAAAADELARYSLHYSISPGADPSALAVAIEPLAKVVKGDSDAAVREAAAFALGNIGLTYSQLVGYNSEVPAAMVELLSEVIAHDSDANTRQTVAKMLLALEKTGISLSPGAKFGTEIEMPGGLGFPAAGVEEKLKPEEVHILIADDEPSIGSMIGLLLTGPAGAAGIPKGNIHVAKTVDAALEIVREFKPQFGTVDMNLEGPGGRLGIEIAKAMKAQDPKARAVLFATLEDSAQVGLKDAGLQDGTLAGFVEKPSVMPINPLLAQFLKERVEPKPSAAGAEEASLPEKAFPGGIRIGGTDYRRIPEGFQGAGQSAEVRYIQTKNIPLVYLGAFSLAEGLSFRIVPMGAEGPPDFARKQESEGGIAVQAPPAGARYDLYVWLNGDWQKLDMIPVEDGIPLIFERTRLPKELNPLLETDLERSWDKRRSISDGSYRRRFRGLRGDEEQRIAIFWEENGLEKRVYLPRQALQINASRGTMRTETRPGWNLNTDPPQYLPRYLQQGHVQVEIMGEDAVFSDLGSTSRTYLNDLNIPVAQGGELDQGIREPVEENTLLSHLVTGTLVAGEISQSQSLGDRPVPVSSQRAQEFPFSGPFKVSLRVNGEPRAAAEFNVENQKTLWVRGLPKGTGHPVEGNNYLSSDEIPVAGQSRLERLGIEASQVGGNYRVIYNPGTGRVTIFNFSAYQLNIEPITPPAAGAEEKLIPITDSKKLNYLDVVKEIKTGIRYYVVNVAGGVAELQRITNPPDVHPVGRLFKIIGEDLERGFQKVVTAAGVEEFPVPASQDQMDRILRPRGQRLSAEAGNAITILRNLSVRGAGPAEDPLLPYITSNKLSWVDVAMIYGETQGQGQGQGRTATLARDFAERWANERMRLYATTPEHAAHLAQAAIMWTIVGKLREALWTLDRIPSFEGFFPGQAANRSSAEKVIQMIQVARKAETSLAAGAEEKIYVIESPISVEEAGISRLNQSLLGVSEISGKDTFEFLKPALDEIGNSSFASMAKLFVDRRKGVKLGRDAQPILGYDQPQLRVYLQDLAESIWIDKQGIERPQATRQSMIAYVIGARRVVIDQAYTKRDMDRFVQAPPRQSNTSDPKYQLMGTIALVPKLFDKASIEKLFTQAGPAVNAVKRSDSMELFDRMVGFGVPDALQPEMILKFLTLTQDLHAPRIVNLGGFGPSVNANSAAPLLLLRKAISWNPKLVNNTEIRTFIDQHWLALEPLMDQTGGRLAESYYLDLQEAIKKALAAGMEEALGKLRERLGQKNIAETMPLLIEPESPVNLEVFLPDLGIGELLQAAGLRGYAFMVPISRLREAPPRAEPLTVFVEAGEEFDGARESLAKAARLGLIEFTAKENAAVVVGGAKTSFTPRQILLQINAETGRYVSAALLRYLQDNPEMYPPGTVVLINQMIKGQFGEALLLFA